jgi:hypothetical protein
MVGPQPVRTTPGAISPLPTFQPNFKNSPKSKYSHTCKSFLHNSNHSHTYAKHGGWGYLLVQPLKFHPQCRRADIFLLPRKTVGCRLLSRGRFFSAKSFHCVSCAKTGGRGCWSYHFNLCTSTRPESGRRATLCIQLRECEMREGFTWRMRRATKVFWGRLTSW